MTSKRTLTTHTRWLHELAYPLTAAEEASALMPELSASSPATSTLALDNNANLLGAAAAESAQTTLTSDSGPVLQFDQAAPFGINPSIAIIGTNGADTLYGTAADDTLDGAGGNDKLYGLEGNDSLIGGTGSDTLDGGLGVDTLDGGAGNERYYVDDAGDVVTEGVNKGTDTVYATISYTLGSNVEHLTLIGSSAINGTGNSLNNIITGNAKANMIDGGTGADTMAGGGGNDTYWINNAGDVVSEAVSQGTDTVQSSISYTLGDNLERLALIGNAAISGTGNALDNYVTGNIKANTINGREGNDILTGLAGADQFVFNTVLSATNVDMITDFNATQGDTIVLDDAVFAQLMGATSLVNHFRLSTQAAVGGDDYIVYSKITGELFYDASGNGTGTLEQFALLSNKPQNLTGSQFVVI